MGKQPKTILHMSSCAKIACVARLCVHVHIYSCVRLRVWLRPTKNYSRLRSMSSNNSVFSCVPALAEKSSFVHPSPSTSTMWNASQRAKSAAYGSNREPNESVRIWHRIFMNGIHNRWRHCSLLSIWYVCIITTYVTRRGLCHHMTEYARSKLDTLTESHFLSQTMLWNTTSDDGLAEYKCSRNSVRAKCIEHGFRYCFQHGITAHRKWHMKIDF